MIWKRYPLFRVFIALCLGILCFNFWEISLNVTLLSLSVSTAFLLLSAFTKSIFSSFRYRPLFGVSVWLFTMSLGMAISGLHSGKWVNNHLLNKDLSETVFRARLLEQPIEKAKSFKSEVKLSHGAIGDSIFPVKGKAILYFQKSKTASTLNYGDVITLRGELRVKPFEYT